MRQEEQLTYLYTDSQINTALEGALSNMPGPSITIPDPYTE